ncbi:MAG: hypothetical protein ACM3N4_12990 [Nitrososphaerota archaeon]
MGTGRWDDDSRWEQGRSPRSRRADDDVRQGRMGSRGGRDNGRGGAGGWDRAPAPGGGSRYSRRDDAGDAWASGGRGRPGASARGDWDDPRGGRGGSPDRSGDRSMRGGRPPARGGSPGYSGSSRRPPQGGGLWGDEDFGPRGRAGMGGAPGMRDPRGMRGGRGASAADPEPEKGKLSFAKGLGIIAGMFALGVAVAVAYFLLTRPAPQLDTPTVPTNTTAPQTTPTAPAATPSPSALVPGAGPAIVFVSARESGSL